MSSYSVPDLSSLQHQFSASRHGNHPHSLRSRCPNHVNLPRLTTSATQLIPRGVHQSSLRFLSFKDTPHMPSHHHTLCPFQTVLRSSAFIAHVVSSIYQDTLDTSTIDPSFDTIRCTTHSQNRRKLLELSPSTSHSSSSRFHCTPTRTTVSPKWGDLDTHSTFTPGSNSTLCKITNSNRKKFLKPTSSL